MNDKWVTFLLDIPISAAISGVASMIGTAIVQGTPVELALAAGYGGLILLLYPIMLALMYGGPIVMIANGLLKRRPGRIVGPLVMIGGLAAYAHGTSALERTAAEVADTRSVSLDGPRPKTVALEGQMIFCLTHCIQILANSDFDVVQRPSPQRPWQRFRKVVGPACDDDAHRNRTIAFIRLGYIGMCSEEVDSDAKVDDAIFISRRNHDSGDWDGAGSFKGEVALVGRIENGTATVLGRWINGKIEAPLQDFLGPLAAKDAKVGSPFVIEDVYRAAIGIPVSDAKRPGPASIPELLAEYERLGDSKIAGFDIGDYYQSLLKEMGPAFASQHLGPMLDSSDVETRKLALLGLETLRGKDLAFAKPALATGLRSDNRDEVYRSAVVLGRIPPKERDFAVDGLIAAALNYIGDTEDRWMHDALSSRLREAARDLPQFSMRLEAWTPANDREGENLAKIKDLLTQ